MSEEAQAQIDALKHQVLPLLQSLLMLNVGIMSASHLSILTVSHLVGGPKRIVRGRAQAVRFFFFFFFSNTEDIVRITPYMSRCRFAQRAGEIAALKKRLADLTAGHVEDMNVLQKEKVLPDLGRYILITLLLGGYGPALRAAHR